MSVVAGVDGAEVLCFGLDEPTGAVADDVLSAEERARAERYRFERDRRRYVRGRAMVRHVLGRYLARQPGAVEIRYNAQGKPFVASGPEFNLAHCEGTAVLAVSGGGRVGVDVERLRPGFADEAVAERFFAPGEIARLRRLAPEERARAFFACWTRKEAVLKALGGGLWLPLDAFEVTFETGRRPQLLSCALAGTDASAWELHDLSGALDGHIVALAVERSDRGRPVPITMLEPPYQRRAQPGPTFDKEQL